MNCNEVWRHDSDVFVFIINILLAFHRYIFPGTQEIGKTKTNESSPGVYEYIIARTLFFDELFYQALK